MLAVIGLGQAGGNIAAEAEKLGLLSGTINFSQKDLDSTIVKHKLRLLGSEGVGKNRNQAIELFQEQWETAINFIKDNFSNSKIIAFAFSSSGGSGSGISPILLDMAINLMPEKLFISLPVIPERSESQAAQMNCLSTFEELSRLDVAVFPIDNQQIRNQNPNVGKGKLYDLSNAEATKLLFTVAEYTTKHSKSGNLDEKDLLTVLRTKGIATISETSISSTVQSINLTPEGVADRVIQSWQDSVFVPLSTGKASRAAILFDGQESLMDFFRTDYVFENFKVPEIFEGYYHDNNGTIITILTGLSWSMERLSAIEISLQNVDEQLDEEELKFSFKPNKSSVSIPTKPKKPNVMDILNKYKR